MQIVIVIKGYVLLTLGASLTDRERVGCRVGSLSF